MKNKEEVLEKLKSDEHYYGEFGKQFLSNSALYNLLNNPADFGKREMSLPLLEGGYFHTVMLEPEKKENYVIVEASSRNTKIYKEAVLESGAEMLLLQKEADKIDDLCAKMKANLDLFELLYHPDNEFEVPAVKEIHGMMWKGKCDVKHPDWVIDIKTTADISKFHRSAYAYNYDSQAWLYEEFFGKPMLFIVICKKTGQMKTFTCSDEFLERGEGKVIDGITQYNKFFGPEKYEDVNNFYTEDVL